MQLLFDYPWYFLLLCLLAGGIYSATLYWRSRTKGESLPRWVRIALPALRFAAVTLIALLLMGPMVRRSVREDEKPLVVLSQDVSESVKPAERLLLSADLKDLQKKYEVVVDSFGGKTTDISAHLQDLADRYAGRNLGAVVLATDGIYNQGQNPTTLSPTLAAPIYTVALGDTTHYRDAMVLNVRYNHVAYLGNQFPLEVTVQANEMAGERATLSVSRGGQRLYSKQLVYDSQRFSATESLVLEADKAGMQSYTISISPCQGEASERNNMRTIAIEVLDGHQKVGILAPASHPDISALRQSIERNPNYEAVVMVEKADMAKVKECSLLILHNLPNTKMNINWAELRQMPTIYIIGTQTDIGHFNALHSGLEIVAKARKIDEVTASHNNAFSLFALDDEVCQRLEQMPPLAAPFGNYRSSADLQSLFHARIGNIASDRPLIAFCQQEGVRRAFVVGEGLWRWRLQDYLMTDSHADFDQLVEKMVVYTSLQANKDRLHVSYEHIYQESEPVVLGAEFYNDNFEPTNAPDVKIEVTGIDGDMKASPSTKTYDFNRTGTGYSLNLGTLEAGEYRFTATTTWNGKSFSAKGSFAVERIDLEQMNLVADHTLLNTLAQTTGGKIISPEEIGQLAELLEARTDLKPVIYSHTRYTELLNLPWIFILLVLLLGAEWAVRKYFLN